jgi:phytoene synthase
VTVRAKPHAPIALTPWADPDPTDVFRAHARTFYAASLLLPPATRRDLAVLYAFCRLVDDCGDEQQHRDTALEWLDAIERDVARAHSDMPLVRRFLALAARHDIHLELARQLIEGVRSDLTRVRIRSEGELLRYCYRVASTVGLMMCRVLNVPREGHEYAVDLGVAMQLTNIARDVAQDAADDRVYLPAEWVEHEHVFHAAEGDSDSAPPVRRSVERILDLAASYYRSADHGMRFLPLPVRPGIRAASANYEAIGDVIRAHNTRFLHTRERTSAHSKAARSALSVARAALDSLPPYKNPSPHDDRLHTHLRPLLTLL